MSEIKIISPIHIASGNEYHIAHIDGSGNGYTLETILIDAVSYGNDNSKQMLFEIANKKNLSREDLMKNLKFSKEKLTHENSIKHKGVLKKSFEYKNVSEAARTLDKLYIPGSSLKGYIINVAWNYVIQENQHVKEYFIKKFDDIIFKYKYEFDSVLNQLLNSFSKEEKKNFGRNLKRIVSNIEREYSYKDIKKVLNNDGLKKVQEMVGARDVIFTDEFEIKLTSRVHKEKSDTAIPTPCVEVIPAESVSNGEFVFFPKNDSKYLSLDSILSFCEDGMNETTKITKTIIECFYNYFSKFYEWFPKANKKFINTIINYEREYVDTFRGTRIDIGKLNEFYNRISKLLDEDKIIIRIGKNTNYILKTIGSAFGIDYYKYFKYIFSPSIDYTKFKGKPDLLTTTFYFDENNKAFPLGYAMIDL